MKKLKKDEKGFTLVELLVVVAIIGILAAIVLVSLNSARERTQRASLQATMSSITTLANLCVNDGGSVSTTDRNVVTGGGYICSNQTITTEVWPALNAQGTGMETAGFQYGAASDTQIVATDDAATPVPVVTCDVTTGSCVLN